MNTYRKNAVVAGILLLLGFLGVATMVLYGDTLDSSADLTGIAANENRILVGVLFNVTMALTCAGIAVALYPVLRHYSRGMALGAVVFRGIENVFSLIVAIIVLLLVALSRDFVSFAADVPFFQTLSGLLLSGHHVVGGFIVPLAWAIGACLYHYIFFKTGLIPRWLALWGLIGVPFTIVAALLGLFDVTTPQSTLDTVLNIPLGLQEIPLALWLIIKGFRPAAVHELRPSPVI